MHARKRRFRLDDAKSKPGDAEDTFGRFMTSLKNGANMVRTNVNHLVRELQQNEKFFFYDSFYSNCW